MEKENIIKQINKLKKEQGAIILAHNYQPGEVQDIADFVGDSLQLAQKAAKVDAKLIVFCGVHFMAETAVIVNPKTPVVMPDSGAMCPMAAMITVEKLKDLKKEHPKAKIVSYVNTTALTKAESDICCTSSNARKVVDSLDCEKIIFVPDKYLGEWVARTSNKEFIFYQGFCPTHMRILDSDIHKLKKQHPKAVVLCHPECTIPVKDASDFVLSTGHMLREVKENPATEFIIATEEGMTHRMKKENPTKKFYHSSPLAVCPNMKKADLAKVLDALENPEEHQVTVPENIRKKAQKAIDRMLEIN